jgi:tripartite-type tricarboxylate transporter receptor subunit TctC
MMALLSALRQGARVALPAAVVGLITFAGPGGAMAQVWPTRPITAIVPIAAGSGSDLTSRVVLDQVSKQVGWPIVIENRPGAGGSLGANVVAKAAPDGHTLLASVSLAVAHALYAKLPYDVLQDFVPVIPLGQQPLVLVTAPSKGFKTLGDLVAAAKTSPGKLNFASGGIGSASHFAAERLRIGAGFDAQHIPFRGAAEGLTETLAGRVDFFFVPIAPAISHIKDGDLLALAVSTSKRAPMLPQVPTTKEAGLTDATYDFWTGLFLPAKTPSDIVRQLHQQADNALRITKVQERLAPLGFEPMPLGLEEFQKYFREDVETTARLVKSANIVAQQ